MVRAVKLEQTPSGSYYNPSQAIFQSLDGSAGAPWVQLSEPTNNATFGLLPSIKLSASLLDPSASVTNVGFFANGAQIGSSAGPSHTFTWNNVAGGVYSVTARAFSSSGLQTNSTPVTMTVEGLAAPLIAKSPSHTGSTFQITFTGTAGRTYSVQRVGALGGTWATIGPATVSAGGIGTFTDNSPLPNAAFYRVVFP
jgi:hypothetical protein